MTAEAKLLKNFIPLTSRMPRTLLVKELIEKLRARGLTIEGEPMKVAAIQDVLIGRVDRPQWVKICDRIRLIDVAKSETIDKLVEDIYWRNHRALEMDTVSASERV
jgi:hypothetical protein